MHLGRGSQMQRCVGTDRLKCFSEIKLITSGLLRRSVSVILGALPEPSAALKPVGRGEASHGHLVHCYHGDARVLLT